MTRAEPGATAGPRFGHAVLATAWMLGLPALTAVAHIALITPGPPAYLSGGLTLGTSLVARALGARFWRRVPESRAIAFSELMLWTWARRLRYQQRIDQGAKLLDLDDALFTDQPWVARPPDQLKTLTRLAAALERKDPYTHGHSRRVSRHSCRTALELGITLDDIEELGQAAALHDVGKIQVPTGVLRKEGPLTIEERLQVQGHSETGAQMVSSLGSNRITGAVLHHHERWDGAGYPRGLAGESIPIFARVIAVADAFDAMTSTRPYRAGMSRERALESLRREAGRQFDPAVVDAFQRTLPALVTVPALISLAGMVRRAVRAGLEWASRTGAATMAPATGSVTAATMAASLVLAVPSGSMSVPPVPKAAPKRAVAAVELSVAATAGGQNSGKHRQPDRVHTVGIPRAGRPDRRRSEVMLPGYSAGEPDSEEPNQMQEKPSEGGTSVGGSATIAQETAEAATSIAAGARETVEAATSIPTGAQETVGHVTSIAADAQETVGDVTSSAAGALEPPHPMDEMNKSTMVLGWD